MIYLDNAATTPMIQEVKDEICQAFEIYGNPSSTHAAGRQAKNIVEQARRTIAQRVKSKPAEITFTSCGTEAANLILKSAVSSLEIKHIISSKLEHKCVLESLKQLEELYDVRISWVEHHSDGSVDLENLEKQLQECESPVLVSIMHANNEIGMINPVKEIAALAHKYDSLYFADMVQTLGHYDINFEEVPVDFASASAHKFHGPKGIGFAYVRQPHKLFPQISGGGQERNLRAGTENVPYIAGLAKAFEMALVDLEEDQKYVVELKKYAHDKIEENFPEAKFHAYSDDAKKSLFGLLSVSLPFRNTMLSFELDLHKIAISQGSACSSGAVKNSPVLSQILPDEVLESTTPLRISFSKLNSKSDVDALVEALVAICAKHA
ncbi:MAG: cysteine desulfurase family protein [Weeksellaceae bacterium]|nr:cysteine desulfurase family protein [Weeksellaceae bacterium]